MRKLKCIQNSNDREQIEFCPYCYLSSLLRTGVSAKAVFARENHTAAAKKKCERKKIKINAMRFYLVMLKHVHYLNY